LVGGIITVSGFFNTATLSSKADFELRSQVSDKTPNIDRKDLWKSISTTEKQAVELLTTGEEKKSEEAYKLLAKSLLLKKSDPFIKLATAYNNAIENEDEPECERILQEMKNVGVPPHLANISSKKSSLAEFQYEKEVVDAGSTFSDTVTEKIRVKVNSFYDATKSDPTNGKFMFWYKVGIYNEGSEPVQIVGRMWEIDKCQGDKEVVRGSGIMSTQPIIPPGDVFTYQSVCPLKVFPPRGKRVLGSMQGAYTMCKGNMGQHNFSVKVGKFNLILPEKM